MQLVELRDITFSYPDRPVVLRGVSFSLEQGQRIGITGPNGAGKSTLFRIAMGLLRPHSGQVLGLGEQLRDEKDFRKLRMEVGYCFQDPEDQLFSPTVLEDVAFGPLNMGLGRQRSLERARQTLDLLGLGKFERRLTYHLSGGEKRLVSLATVMAMSPKGLLMDEPTSGLDPKTQTRLEDILQASDMALAIISHDHDFLGRTCGTIMKLEDGILS